MNDEGARVVRRSQLRATPWRNGGGVTFEIARAPREGEVFTHRLSLAQIDRDGPFSDFSGYQRALTLISGAGCRLYGVRAEPLELRTAGASALFDGAAAVRCELLAGPCVDLNLMVRAPASIVSVEHLELPAHETAPLREGCEASVFCLEGAIECLNLASGERIALAQHDVLLAPPTSANRWRLMRGAADVSAAVVHAWRPAEAAHPAMTA